MNTDDTLVQNPPRRLPARRKHVRTFLPPIERDTAVRVPRAELDALTKRTRQANRGMTWKVARKLARAWLLGDRPHIPSRPVAILTKAP